MAATFLLLTVLVQLSAGMTARSAADAAVAAATRRISLHGVDLAMEEERLIALIGAVVPGVEDITADLDLGLLTARGWVRFRWVPPGPLFAPFTIEVDAEVPIAVAP
jgi:hypothetical protein